MNLTSMIHELWTNQAYNWLYYLQNTPNTYDASKPRLWAIKKWDMEKVYLLLRDNVESGPYTIQELLQNS